MSRSRQIDVSIDGKHFLSEGERIDLRVNGKKVYSTEKSCNDEGISIKKLDDWTVVNYFLKIALSAFGHPDRFKIISYLAESPKAFSEIKKLLGSQSPSINFHLKSLVNETLIFKDENGKYALSLMGELVLDYFSNFIKKVSCLNNTVNTERINVKTKD